MSNMHFHVGRAWEGLAPFEVDCPCGKAPCGLIDSSMISERCDQHRMSAAKTMRQMHGAGDCPMKPRALFTDPGLHWNYDGQGKTRHQEACDSTTMLGVVLLAAADVYPLLGLITWLILR